ncbi:S41 family peptidase [Dokdonia sp. PRO95]|uniref:S41 family peptidase n=1 Tax=Dokdonia sp. PRO95 TaxID=1239415 RepID=UPI0009DF0428|nr:S41 family peptidase [Dokdonia sp. PRO95]
MKKIISVLTIILASVQILSGQDFGDFPKIKKDKLLNDLELLYQGLDKFHTGMYWYTPKDSVDFAFEMAKSKITTDLNVLEFHKIIAPLVALSREDHTNIYLPEFVSEKLNEEIKFLPFTVVFLDKQLYVVKNGSDFEELDLQGKVIESINGETPIQIVEKIGNLFASDGFIKTVKYSDLEGFNLSKYYFYFYGQLSQFKIKFKNTEEILVIKSQTIDTINKNLKSRYKVITGDKEKDLLEFKFLDASTAYLGIHSFSNSDIKEESKETNLKTFLRNSFNRIKERNIQTLIIDVSENSGGTEGNEGILYSYFGDNYQKYLKVKAKTQKAILDNDVDKPITLKTFGFLERVFANKKMKDKSYERKQWIGYGLTAYNKEPEYKFKGKIYIIISPVTYSGGSEFSNMMFTNDLATFVGQETGGGYLGNTSGYSQELKLPNSQIEISIPALQFLMNVKPKLPFGSGVKPHYKVIPTFEQYLNGENASLHYILEQLENKN